MKAEAQKAELHRTIWRMANDLRGSVDGWDFKAYVLGMLFYRFISENLAAAAEETEAEGFSYAALSDEEADYGRVDLVKEKGYFIYPSQLFCNVRARAHGDENLNETLEQAFNAIENSAIGTDSEDDLRGLFADVDMNSLRLGSTVIKRNQKLAALLNSVGDLDFGRYCEASIDAFGARGNVEFFAQAAASIEDIAANDYNLSMSSYVEPEDTREVIDIVQLNAEIAQIVKRQAELRSQIDAIVADLEGKND